MNRQHRDDIDFASEQIEQAKMSLREKKLMALGAVTAAIGRYIDISEQIEDRWYLGGAVVEIWTEFFEHGKTVERSTLCVIEKAFLIANDGTPAISIRAVKSRKKSLARPSIKLVSAITRINFAQKPEKIAEERRAMRKRQKQLNIEIERRRQAQLEAERIWKQNEKSRMMDMLEARAIQIKSMFGELTIERFGAEYADYLESHGITWDQFVQRLFSVEADAETEGTQAGTAIGEMLAGLSVG